MLFAPVRYLTNSLEELNRIIQNNTPISSDSQTVLAEKLALIHNELNIVHPFRDGNGRTIRLFLDVLVHTLGFQPINYSDRKKYLAACVAGALQNNGPVQKIIEAGLIKRAS